MSPAETVLIVEDNPDSMKLFASVLALAGYRVLQASSPREVPELVRTARPDLVLMDIQLPGVDGVTLMGRIREDMGSDAPVVVALTAHAMRGDAEKYLAAGFDGYLSKPISVPDFPSQVRGFLDRRS